MSDILKEFIENDIVSIKRGNCNDNDETPLFTISQLENDKVYFSGLETAYSIEDLVPVSMTDKAIENINYRLPTMASASFDCYQPKAQIPPKESLNQIFNNEYLSDLIKKHSIKYVHDLQHVLIKENIDINIRVANTTKPTNPNNK